MSKLDIENAPDEIKAELDRMRAPLPKMTDTRDSLQSVIADLRTYAQAIRTSPTCSCNECDLCAWIAIDPDTFSDRLTALLSTEWKPIESAPVMKSVFIHYKNARGNSRIIKAKFIPKYTLEAGENTEDEYDEANDRYTCKEGWYESIDNWDDFSCVFVYQGTPDSWMPLPKAIDSAQATEGK